MVGAWCLSPRGGRQARSGGWQIGLGLRYCALSQGGVERWGADWRGCSALIWNSLSLGKGGGGGDKLNKKQQQIRRFWIIREERPIRNPRKPWHFVISILWYWSLDGLRSQYPPPGIGAIRIDFYIDVFPLSLSSFVCIIQMREWFLKFNQFCYQ